ncbi:MULTISPECIES: hypothetical protein [Bizionia]|uniref:SGNH/GDSL hydrolase family protein n=1 Tax=Bizionia algoritergicola TaxID=291187 RepID=A0A5D0R3X5_9FLAO|nr:MULTISPECIES: hypothetical protein [Bizionia]OBX24353.1 hypothetical protein BAA08_00735 [Bizionia sp. APA-3]TYB75274.1 hypothetical protein ES675_03875 [Bizionia algoritergicola]
MKSFLKTSLLFLIPAIIVLVAVIAMDFFKVLGFQDYYVTQKIVINREMVTAKSYRHFRDVENYNAFIFGSSRSHAFKCENWKAYLDPDAKPFHFDAFGEGLWGISKKIEYIDELGDSIKHALVIIDRSILDLTTPRISHVSVPDPQISKASKLDYYGKFLKASLNPQFLMAYTDFSLTNTYRDYMRAYINHSEYKDVVNTKTCDIWYGWDEEIQKDSLAFYENLNEKHVFYNRKDLNTPKSIVSVEEIAQLNRIKAIFDKHNTQYKIVISPIYNQIPMETEHVELLETVFGSAHLYNFSGKNNFTEPAYNYYDTSHYRPHVANAIMKLIYN